MVMNSPKKRQLEETIVSKVIRTLKDGRAKRAEQQLPEAEPIGSSVPSANDLFRVAIRRGLHFKGTRTSEDARSLPRVEEKTYEEAQNMWVPVLVACILMVFLFSFSYLL